MYKNKRLLTLALIVLVTVSVLVLMPEVSINKSEAVAQDSWHNCDSDTNTVDASFSYGYRSENSTAGYWWYFWCISLPSNSGDVFVTQYWNGSVIRILRFGPGGGFADYVVCDSIDVEKYGGGDEIVSFGGCSKK